MKDKYLSVIKNAGSGSITYYVGENKDDVAHLKNCILICKHGFSPQLENVELVHVDNPQLKFYELSKDYKEDYLDSENLVFSKKYNSYIHKAAKIGTNVKIGPNATIGNAEIDDNVTIHPNVVIYSKTHIQKNVTIEANTTIGGTGIMWVWNKSERVYLEQLGNVIIQEDCIIGSHCQIVRGSANETTIIGKSTCMAHGTLIGHGCHIGNYNHFANGIKLGGGCITSDYNFLGSGAVLSAGNKILAQDVILGAGAIVVKDIIEEGVYVGNPAKRIKSSTGKLSGIPKWDRNA